MNNIFKKGKAYDFDEVYQNCKYAVVNTDCNCNNGYICSHKKNEEECEGCSKLKKCYAHSCPLVASCASRKVIEANENIDVDSVDFDKDGFSEDYEELVEWLGVEGVEDEK